MKHEFAFRFEVALIPIILTLLYIIFHDFRKILIAFAAYLLILLAEALNSAIEKTCDEITLERSENIKYAKDAGSLAVMISMIVFIITVSVMV